MRDCTEKDLARGLLVGNLAMKACGIFERVRVEDRSFEESIVEIWV
jgi:hypothetical protein